MKPTDRKSWARNLLMWSDVNLGPSFKVKYIVVYHRQVNIYIFQKMCQYFYVFQMIRKKADKFDEISQITTTLSSES